jgi:hypothetical protein
MGDLLPENFITLLNGAVSDFMSDYSGFIYIVLGVIAVATIISVVINALKSH